MYAACRPIFMVFLAFLSLSLVPAQQTTSVGATHSEPQRNDSVTATGSSGPGHTDNATCLNSTTTISGSPMVTSICSEGGTDENGEGDQHDQNAQGGERGHENGDEGGDCKNPSRFPFPSHSTLDLDIAAPF